MVTIPKSVLLRIILSVLVALCGSASAYWLSLVEGLAKLDLEAKQRVEAVSAAIFAPTEKYRFLPEVVSTHPVVLSASAEPTNIRKRNEASGLLTVFSRASGAEVIYLIGRDGVTLASSNWDRPDSFVGHNFTFRPYFKDALDGREGRFYGMGTVSRTPGYYMSRPLTDGVQVVAVIVVKIDLTSLDAQWAKDPQFDVAVSDEHGVIFLSDRSEWKYRPLRPLASHQTHLLEQTKQYGLQLRAPMRIERGAGWGGTRIWQVDTPDTDVDDPASRPKHYVIQQKRLDGAPWTVSVLLRAGEVQREATYFAGGVLAILILTFFGVSQFLQQRRRITERMLAQQAMQVSHERFSIVSRATSDVVWDWDLQNDLLSWNENLASTFGHRPEELEPGGAAWVSRIHCEDRQRVLDGFNEAIAGKAERWSDEYRFLCKDGRVATVSDRGFVIRDAEGRAVRMVGSITDISQRKESERAIHKLAFYDSLTGLPNRALLYYRLREILAVNEREHLVGALLFLDLDNFKSLNDSLGHHKGDLILGQVAARLVQCVRDSDTVARLGGDEFVIMLTGLSHISEEAGAKAKVVAQKVLHAFVEPFDLEGVVWHTSTSIGVTLFHGMEARPEDILKQADLAMYAAKEDGRNTLRFFAPQMETLVQARTGMEAELRRALAQDELLLYFQPQCDHVGKITGAEALLRWQHPTKGLISPLEFIPLAEQTGLIVPIGHWVLKEACLQLARWAEDPVASSWTISVNVSACQFYRADFTVQVREIVEEARVDPHRLKIELTESALISDIDAAIVRMEEIKRLGIDFALDDFGTGYSSLAYLHRLPISQLKIDRSFVAKLPDDTTGAAIVSTIIALGRKMGLSVVAEGVETAGQVAYLAERACDSYQGYLFGRPVPLHEFGAQ